MAGVARLTAIGGFGALAGCGVVIVIPLLAMDTRCVRPPSPHPGVEQALVQQALVCMLCARLDKGRVFSDGGAIPRDQSQRACMGSLSPARERQRIHQQPVGQCPCAHCSPSCAPGKASSGRRSCDSTHWSPPPWRRAYPRNRPAVLYEISLPSSGAHGGLPGASLAGHGERSEGMNLGTGQRAGNFR